MGGSLVWGNPLVWGGLLVDLHNSCYIHYKSKGVRGEMMKYDKLCWGGGRNIKRNIPTIQILGNQLDSWVTHHVSHQGRRKHEIG